MLMLNVDVPDTGMSIEEYYRKTTKQAKKQARMENDLRAHGTEVPGGYSMTHSQMAQYFLDVEKRKKKRR